MSELRVNGIRLYYEEHGEGVPILCVHGTGSSALTWQPALPELARLGRVIAYDRRGCARSERPRPYERTSVAEHADDAAALRGALAATPAIVIGRSYGGEVAIDMALRHPDSVRALVLLEPAPLWAPTPQMAAFAERLVARMHDTAAAGGVDAVGRAFIGEVLGEQAWTSFPQQIRDVVTGNSQAILAELDGEPLIADSAALAAIAQPTLLVGAADSHEVFRESNDRLAATMPTARRVDVDGGHLIDPADPVVVSFLETQTQLQAS